MFSCVGWTSYDMPLLQKRSFLTLRVNFSSRIRSSVYWQFWYGCGIDDLQTRNL